MLGAPLAGVLIALLGPANVLILDAATFAVSAFLMRAFVPAPPPRDAEAAPERYLAQLREGFGFVWRTPLVRAMVVMVLITNMLDAAMGGVLMPVYADRVLDSVVALGLMSGGMGLTAFLGTLVFAWIGHRLPRVSTLVAGFTLGGPSRFFFLATLPGVGPAIAGFTIAGAGIGVVNPILGTLQYERVPERLRARVFGAVSAGVMAGAPVGALLGAALVELIGLQETFLVFGTVYLACTLSPLWVPAWRDANRRLEPT
jgi:MFS family permease